MTTPNVEPLGKTLVRTTPSLNLGLKPRDVTKEPRGFISKKEYENHLINSPTKRDHEKAYNMGDKILKVSEATKNKMTDEWMRGGGRDPNGRGLDQEIKIGKDILHEKQKKINQLKEQQQPQYGVKKFNSHEDSTFPYNQPEALATADAMDKAVANTKTRINQIHKNPASKIIEKQQSINDLQRVTDIAYKYSNDQWAHKPEWKLDRRTGSPIDVADPNYKNARTVKQLENLKSWSQGGKVNAPAKPKPMPILNYINKMNKLYGNNE